MSELQTIQCPDIWGNLNGQTEAAFGSPVVPLYSRLLMTVI